MSAKYVAFKAEHLKELLKESSAESMRELMTDKIIERIEKTNPYVMSIEMNGEIVTTGGVTQYWPGRGESWVFYKESIKSNFLPVFRLVKNWLDEIPIRRIEAAVDVNETFGRRSVELYGFKLEAPLMKSFLPSGADCALYAKVK